MANVEDFSVASCIQEAKAFRVGVAGVDIGRLGLSDGLGNFMRVGEVDVGEELIVGGLVD